MNQTQLDCYATTPLSYIQMINQPDLFNDPKRKREFINNFCYYNLSLDDFNLFKFTNLSQCALFVKSSLISRESYQKLLDSLINSKIPAEILSIMLSSSAFDTLLEYILVFGSQHITFANSISINDTLTLEYEYFSPPSISKYLPKFQLQIEPPNNNNPFSFFKKFLLKMDKVYMFKYRFHQKMDFYTITRNAFHLLIRDNKDYGCYANKTNFSILRPKYHIDLNKLKFDNLQSNWVTDKIQLDIFVQSFFSCEIFKSTFHRFELSLAPQIRIFFETTHINNLPVLYSLLKQENAFGSKEVDELDDWFSDTLNTVQRCINYFIEIITSSKKISIIEKLSYEDFSQLMLTFRFIFNNFLHPYNYIQVIADDETMQNLLFNEIMCFSNIFSTLLEDLFTSLQPCSIPFIQNFVLADIFGNRIAFIPSNERQQSITTFCGNSIQETFTFNYNSSISITYRKVGENSCSQYSIGDYFITYSPKSQGSTFGIIIEIERKSDKSFHHQIFCKELFYFSKSFTQTLYERVFVIGVKAKIPDSQDIKQSHIIMKMDLNYYNLFFIFHNDPHIEMLGYSLLNALDLCPRLTFFRSVFDLKTYIMMEKIPSIYKFYEFEEFSEALSTFSIEQLREAMILFHQLKIIHCLFLFCDFHNQNIALNVDIQNGIKSIQLIDQWPCQSFFPVAGLFNPICYQNSTAFIGACYNRFNRLFLEEFQDIKASYYKLTYDSFLRIVIRIYDAVLDSYDSDKFDSTKPLSIFLIRIFFKKQIKKYKKDNFVSMEQDKFAMMAYYNYITSSTLTLISHFANGTPKQLREILSGLVFIRFYLDYCRNLQRKELCYEEMFQFELLEQIIIYLDEEQINNYKLETEMINCDDKVFLLLSYTTFSCHILAFDIFITILRENDFDVVVKPLKLLPK